MDILRNTLGPEAKRLDTRMSNTLRTIKKVSLVSALVNFLLAAFKVIIGHIGFSQALIADGIHSLSDLLTDGLVMLTAKMGQEHPDHDHPYGHRRIETIGTIVIAILIIVIAVGLAADSLSKIHHQSHTLPSLWVLVVAAFSVVANEGLFRYLMYHSKRIRSSLLESNAWHNRSDVYVSLIVLVGAAMQYAGLHYIDLIASFLVAAMIFKMGASMIMRCVRELIDTAADPETQAIITDIIENTPGVLGIHHLRTRLHSGDILLDAHLQVKNTLTVSEGHLIGDRVMHALYHAIDHVVDITIHIDAEDDDHISPETIMNLPTREQIIDHLKAHQNKLTHLARLIDFYLHYEDGSCRIELIFPSSLRIKNTIDLLKEYDDVLSQIPSLEETTLLIQYP